MLDSLDDRQLDTPESYEGITHEVLEGLFGIALGKLKAAGKLILPLFILPWRPFSLLIRLYESGLLTGKTKELVPVLTDVAEHRTTEGQSARGFM
jgi:hypothetical protein